MGIAQHFHRATPATRDATISKKGSSTFWPLFAANAVLSALSITNLGLISSMVGFLLDQKHHVHSYEVNWPGNNFRLNVEPKYLWTNQGHTSNGVAGFGFFLGIFGMITAWRLRKAARPPKTLVALVVLLSLAVLFTLSAFIFVFVVTYQTTGQHIREPVAANNIGTNYPEFHWTPETWFKAVLDLPLADHAKHNQIHNKVRNMVAWRWILLPIFLVDCTALTLTILAWLHLTRKSSTQPIDKERA